MVFLTLFVSRCAVVIVRFAPGGQAASGAMPGVVLFLVFLEEVFYFLGHSRGNGT